MESGTPTPLPLKVGGIPDGCFSPIPTGSLRATVAQFAFAEMGAYDAYDSSPTQAGMFAASTSGQDGFHEPPIV